MGCMKYLLFLIVCLSVHAKEMKLLVLNIAADGAPYYVELQKIWRTYMNYDPEHVESYFLKYDPNLDVPYKIEDSVIWFRGEETYIPGIADKTVLAMEVLKPRLKEFDFVLRTNLSSFVIFPRLLEFLKTLPKTGLYYACENKILRKDEPYIPFGSGAALIFSPDVVEMMVRDKHKLIGKDLIDDVLFGWFFHEKKVPLRIATRMDILDLFTWIAWKDRIPENHYHFRLKNPDHRRMTDELMMHKAMVKMFYGTKGS